MRCIRYFSENPPIMTTTPFSHNFIYPLHDYFFLEIKKLTKNTISQIGQILASKKAVKNLDVSEASML